MCIKTLWMKWIFFREFLRSTQPLIKLRQWLHICQPCVLQKHHFGKVWNDEISAENSRKVALRRASTLHKKSACGAGIQRLCEAPAFIAGVPIVCQIFARKAGQRVFVDCNKLVHQQGMIRNMWQPFLMCTFELRSHFRHVSHHNKHIRSVKM